MSNRDDADLPPVPKRLGKPDLIVKMPQPYTLPAAGSDVWRSFVIPIPVSNVRYVKTVELQPGSARFVHHALMGIDEMRAVVAAQQPWHRSAAARERRGGGPPLSGRAGH
jgi:hypothetical protein